jgi:hypothetical protein
MDLVRELRGVRSALWGDTVPEDPPLESIRLYKEHEGVTLQDPIPHTEHLAGAGQSTPPSRMARVRKRIARRVRRIAESGLGPRGKDLTENE